MTQGFIYVKQGLELLEISTNKHKWGVFSSSYEAWAATGAEKPLAVVGSRARGAWPEDCVKKDLFLSAPGKGITLRTVKGWLTKWCTQGERKLDLKE